MSQEKQQIATSNNRIRFLKVLFSALLLLSVFFYFHSLLSWEVLLIIAISPLLFWGLRDKLWVFLVISVPALLLGKIVSFHLGGGWIYEARLTELLLLLAFVIFILNAFINSKTVRVRVDKITFVLSLYLILSLLSFYYIIDFRYFAVGIKVIVFSFISYFLAMNILTDRISIKWFLRSVALSVLVLSFQVLVKFYEMGFSSKFFFERSFITVPLGPIALVSAVLAFLLPILLALFFSQKEWNTEKVFTLLAFSAGGVAVFLSLGKAAIFSAGVAMLYLFIKLKEKRALFLAAGAGFLVLSAVLFTSFFAGLIERISRTFVSENTQFRITEYQTGWEVIKNNFLLGVGSGQQLAYYKEALNWDDPQLVNNFFLQALVDLGVIGLGLAVSAVVFVYEKARDKIKSIRPSRRTLVYGFVAAFIACFINGLAEVTVFALPYAVIFWLVLGAFVNINDRTIQPGKV